VLKPQDLYVALKILAAKSGRAPYPQLAGELVMSPSEVHASVHRADHLQRNVFEGAAGFDRGCHA
jgi:hypothetical protein